MHSFYDHVNKKWLENNSIPLDQTNWSIFTMLQEKMRVLLLELVKNSDNYHIRTFWQASNNKQLIDKLGLEVIPIELRDAYAFGGGLHCSTADVFREGNLKDYFPNQ